jgi:carboxyl-terminal processing protease
MKTTFRYTLVLSVTLALGLGLFSFTGPGERYFAIVKNLDIFATLFKEVNAYYVDEVNPNELMRVGIEAMLASLDPYTNYIPEEDIEDFRTMTTGQYGGIGALIGKRKGQSVVLMPYEGFPAYEAGLRIGDVIEAIDGREVDARISDDLSKLLKGQANTSVELRVRRYGVDEPLTFKLKRARITVENVPYSGMVNDKIGYVRLSEFTSGAAHEMKQAIEQLKARGAKSLILDLRDNPGGLLSEAIDISNLFIPKGAEVVSTRGKVTQWNKTYTALNEPLDLQIPLAVLISSGSASASEIVAGVMQDYDRGVLIGDKTFGKGLVQTTRPLTYNAQLKVTTAKYYIPSGRCIQSIDYSHREEGGKAQRVADSLKVKFLTKQGRPVYDGGGIDPDVLLEPEPLAPVSASLLANNLIFDYATAYYYANPNKKFEAASFDLSDAEYNEFLSWLNEQEFDYATEAEQAIEELEQIAREEKSYEGIADQFEALRQSLQHNKKNDLKAHSEEIRQLLEQEIASRYYLQDGYIEATFETDENIQAAVKVLNDPAKYKQLLAY